MKQNSNQETENLLSLIFQSNGQVMVKDSQLLVGPGAIAQRFGDQIRRLKPEILLALGHCPECGEKLVVEVGELSIKDWSRKTKTGRHLVCPEREKGHFDQWQF